MRHTLFLIAVLASPFRTEAFARNWDYSIANPAGFFTGIWHGLLAPWSLIARWFFDGVQMYVFANTGWFYDLGFLIGVGGSIPIGWAAAIVSAILHILGV